VDDAVPNGVRVRKALADGTPQGVGVDRGLLRF
jgi:hypothetical protein